MAPARLGGCCVGMAVSLSPLWRPLQAPWRGVGCVGGCGAAGITHRWCWVGLSASVVLASLGQGSSSPLFSASLADLRESLRPCTVSGGVLVTVATAAIGSMARSGAPEPHVSVDSRCACGCGIPASMPSGRSPAFTRLARRVVCLLVRAALPRRYVRAALLGDAWLATGR